MLERQLNEEAAKNLALNEIKNLDLSHTPSTSLRTGFEMTKNHFNSNTNVFSSKTRNLDLSRSPSTSLRTGFEMTDSEQTACDAGLENPIYRGICNSTYMARNYNFTCPG